MTLPALLQSACTAYTSCRSGAHAQQQTSCTPLLPSIDGTDRRTDGRTRAYYASSVNNKGYVLGGRCPGAVVQEAVVRETIVRGGRMSGHPLSALWAVGQTQHAGTRRAVLIHYRLSRSLARRQSPFTSARNQYIRSRDLIHREGANSQPAS